MRSLIIAASMVLLAGGPATGLASDSAIGDDTKASDQASDAAKSTATAAAREPAPLELPPGFKAKKRGDITLYCIKGRATGTRFQTEACYDEAQLRDYLLAREQNNRDFERSRAICSNPSICAPE